MSNFLFSDEQLMSIVPCSKCERDEVFANLQDCVICDKLLDGCADCYDKHVEAHTPEETEEAFFRFYCPEGEVENYLTRIPTHWYDLN